MARSKFTVTFNAGHSGDEVTWPNTVEVFADSSRHVPIQAGQLDEARTFVGWSEASSIIFRHPASGGSATVVAGGSGSSGTAPDGKPKFANCSFLNTVPIAVDGSQTQLLFNPALIVEGPDWTGNPADCDGLGLTVNGSGYLVIPNLAGKMLALSWNLAITWADASNNGKYVAVDFQSWNTSMDNQTQWARIHGTQAKISQTLVDFVPASYTSDGSTAVLLAPVVTVSDLTVAAPQSYGGSLSVHLLPDPS